MPDGTPFVLVLVEPQEAANVGAVVRVMKNYGQRRLRLVNPAAGAWDPVRIEIMAHRSQDIVAGCQIVPSLAEALADVTTVVGTTARVRAGRTHPLRPAEAAAAMQARAAAGTVAILFGPETNGLSNSMLDACHLLINIPAAAAYPSLNLAQAALIVCYELWLAGQNDRQPAGKPQPDLAAVPDLDALFADASATLAAIGFLKPGRETAVMRRLRDLVFRARPSRQEVALLHAISREIRKSVQRNRTR